MHPEFLEDVGKIAAARQQLEKMALEAKPWREYIDKMTEYVIAKYFGAYGVGKHTVSLPDGSTIEYDNGENVAVREELLPVVFDQMIGAQDRENGAPYTDEQVKALNQLYKLVRWAPSLDKRQYDKLPPESQKLFEQALQRTRAKPKLTIKAA